MVGWRKETEDETKRRILKLADDKDCGMFPPPMNAQVAVNELIKHFLGDNWYSVNPISAEQINTEAVYEIERIYKRWVKKAKRAKK